MEVVSKLSKRATVRQYPPRTSSSKKRKACDAGLSSSSHSSSHHLQGPSKRSSSFRGVTRHRWTGRYEAHLWDKSCWNDKQRKKGRQVYLGAYDDEASAAQAYDLAALKYWGPGTVINFKLDNYEQQLAEMENISRDEYLATLRRKSSGFSRGVSKYRGVARHHHNGRWEARIGRVDGNKYLYLGTFGTQEEAARAYDMAAIEYRGAAAVTNFDLTSYSKDLQRQSRCARDGGSSNELGRVGSTNFEQKCESRESAEEEGRFVAEEFSSGSSDVTSFNTMGEAKEEVYDWSPLFEIPLVVEYSECESHRLETNDTASYLLWNGFMNESIDHDPFLTNVLHEPTEDELHTNVLVSLSSIS